MFGIPVIEWIGYAASVCVGVSLIMSDIFKLRIINAIGCLLFVVYGFTVKAYPVGVINGFCLLIDIYYIVKLKKQNQLQCD